MGLTTDNSLQVTGDSASVIKAQDEQIKLLNEKLRKAEAEAEALKTTFAHRDCNPNSNPHHSDTNPNLGSIEDLKTRMSTAGAMVNTTTTGNVTAEKVRVTWLELCCGSGL